MGRGLLNRMATWVAIVVEDMETLCRLYQMSGDPCGAFERRLLVVSATSPMHPRPRRRRPAQWVASLCQVNELAFHTVMTQAQIADYDDVSRLLRSGYGEALSPRSDRTPGRGCGTGQSLKWFEPRPASAVARHLPGTPWCPT